MMTAQAALPLWFTPLQAVGWIVMRHPAFVVGPDAEQDRRRSHLEERRGPDGKSRLVEVQRRPSLNLLRLELERLSSIQAGDEMPRPTPKDAVAELLKALREGRLVARAAVQGERGRRSIETDEWATLSLGEMPRDERAVVPTMQFTASQSVHAAARFADVLLPGEAVLKLWPPRASSEPVIAWMNNYATDFLAERDRPPARETDAVVDAKKAGFGINRARMAYAALPDHLKVATHKPKKLKLE